MPRIFGGGLAVLLLAGLATPSGASDYVGSGTLGIRGGLVKFSSNGLSYALGGRTLQADPQPRLSGDLVFGYVWSDRVTTDLTVGFGWNRLNTNDPNFWIAAASPLTVTGRYLLRSDEHWRPYVGVGGGLYVWSILSKDLGPASDPITFERLRRARPGGHAMIGMERRFTKHFGATVDGAYHYIFAQDTENFPNGYNGNKGYYQVRAGVNVFFSLSERIDTGLPE
jgi:outer membrane protein W